jgi:hypothetical protein
MPTVPGAPRLPTLYLHIKNEGDAYCRWHLSAAAERESPCAICLTASEDTSLNSRGGSLPYAIRTRTMQDPQKYAANLDRLLDESTVVHDSAEEALKEQKVDPVEVLAFVSEACCAFRVRFGTAAVLESYPGNWNTIPQTQNTFQVPSANQADFLNVGGTIFRLASVDAILRGAARDGAASTEDFVARLSGPGLSEWTGNSRGNFRIRDPKFPPMGNSLAIEDVRRQIRALLFEHDCVRCPARTASGPCSYIDMYSFERGGVAFACESGHPEHCAPGALVPSPDPIAYPFRGKITFHGPVGEIYAAGGGRYHLPHVATHAAFASNDSTPAALVAAILHGASEWTFGIRDPKFPPVGNSSAPLAWFSELRRMSLQRLGTSRGGWTVVDNDPLLYALGDFHLRSVLFAVSGEAGPRCGVVYITKGSRAATALAADGVEGLGGEFRSMPFTVETIPGFLDVD